jgi:TIR domain/zinc-ribbon domain
MKRVFVSYSRNNLGVVRQLIEDMKAVGIDAWHDETLTGGQRWWDNILANIRDCDIFIFALSPESWDSEACRSELGYVAHLGKTILPVLVAEGVNLNLLSPPLNEIQVTDYRRCDKEAAFALVKSINTAPTASPLPDPLPGSPPVPVSYLSTLKDRIDSHTPLSAQDQITLLFELEAGIKEGRSQNEIRDLLLRLKRREELLAKVATKVDAALKSLDEAPPAPPRTGFGAAPPRPAGPEARAGDRRPSEQAKFCPHCSARVEAGARFCAACGSPLVDASAPKAPIAPPAQVHPVQGGAKPSKSRRYSCAPEDGSRVVAEVKSWLDAQGFDSQQIATEEEGVLLQVKKRGAWRDFVGMSTSLNVAFHQQGDALTVDIGAGKWIDKAAAGAVSMVILWPLAVTASFGAWEQMKMPERIFDYIGSRLAYR